MIDITKDALNKLTIDDLIEDACERNDETALIWLQTESNSMKERKNNDGTTYQVRKSIVEIRPAYLKKFLGYTTKSEAAKVREREKKKQKVQKELDDKFARAFARLK